MKKVVLIVISMAFVLVMLASCNKSICPAYASQTDAVQVENNG